MKARLWVIYKHLPFHTSKRLLVFIKFFLLLYTSLDDAGITCPVVIVGVYALP